jgi:hypothetical protein
MNALPSPAPTNTNSKDHTAAPARTAEGAMTFSIIHLVWSWLIRFSTCTDLLPAQGDARQGHSRGHDVVRGRTDHCDLSRIVSFGCGGARARPGRSLEDRGRCRHRRCVAGSGARLSPPRQAHTPTVALGWATYLLHRGNAAAALPGPAILLVPGTPARLAGDELQAGDTALAAAGRSGFPSPHSAGRANQRLVTTAAATPRTSARACCSPAVRRRPLVLAVALAL